MRRKGPTVVPVVLFGLGGIGGLGIPAAAGAQADNGAGATLVVASLQDVDSLNPFLGANAAAVQVFRSTYDYLTDYSPDTNAPAPGLAERWQVTDGGRTWTFRLRASARWSDGRSVTAADVVFTYRTVMARPALANAALLRNVRAVSAPDPHTVVLRTAEPSPTMLALDVPIVPEHVWAGRDPGGPPPDAAASVSSGPFRMVSARQGQSYELRRNPSAAARPGGGPRVERLVFRYFGNSDAAVQALRRGEVDVVAGITPAQHAALAGEPAIARNVAHGSRFTELGINPGATRADGTAVGDGNPALRDVRVRRAIDQAIDRDALVRRVLAGFGEPAAGYLPASYRPWGWTPAADQRRGFDPAAANRALDAAGYRRGPDRVRRAPGGKRLELDLLVPTGRAHYGQSATFIVRWLADVGIAVRPRQLSDTDKAVRVSAGRYDLFLGGWVLDSDPDYLLSVQTCAARPDSTGAGTTDTFGCNPEYDALYTRQALQMDPVQRVSTVHEMQQRLYADAVVLPIYAPAVLEAYRADRFTGMVRRPQQSGGVAGYWSYAVVRPVARTAAGGDGPPVGLLAGAACGLVLVVTGAAAVRSRRTRDRRA